jgi:hypothetical protein
MRAARSPRAGWWQRALTDEQLTAMRDGLTAEQREKTLEEGALSRNR